jgi:photosystem II stability/assembly factor-like uncharacterized protein
MYYPTIKFPLPLLTILCLLAGVMTATAQEGKPSVKMMSENTKTSIRGLSVVDDEVVWVSGSNGMVGRSMDGGQNWKWITVKGFEKSDFRDIEAFDASTAVIISIAEPAYILRTQDGGNSWKVVYENKTKGMFLDAMEFWNNESGIVIGDPIDGRFFIARTFNGGQSWVQIPTFKSPAADSGEACFASSGTNIRKISKDEAIFITGGLRSRLVRRNKSVDIPILQGKESTGANSIAIRDKKHFIVVGGDFTADTLREKNCIISNDGGKTWKSPVTPPNGYRSCVEFFDKSIVITCGLTGVDFSTDGGMNWAAVSATGFHVCRKAKKGRSVFFAGGNGRVGKLVW